MNRELFISDFKRLSRLYSEDELPGVIADYVKKMPNDLRHFRGEASVEMDKVISLCCEHFRASFEDIKKKNRRHTHTYKRQVLIYLLMRRTRIGYRKISELLDRDHSTVAHAMQRIRELVEIDKSVRQEIEMLNNQL